MSSFNGWAIVTLPSFPPAPKSIEWQMGEVVGAAKSPFSLQQQIYSFSQGILRASLSYPLMTNTHAIPWRVFLAGLQGIANIFQFGDPLNKAPQSGSATGGTVTGGGQTGYQLFTSSTNLTAGDWIQIGLRLYMVTSVSGGTLGVWPPLRESPANATSIVITNTKGLFRLTKNERGYGVSVQDGRAYSLTFEIEEAL